jgi:hypothetical protein
VLEGLKQQGVSLHMIDLGGDVTGNGISKLGAPSPKRSATASASASPM